MTDRGGDSPSDPEPELTPTIIVTGWRHIGVAAVVGALVGRTVVLVVTSVTGVPPTLPWTLVAVIWLLVLAVAELARSTRRRVHLERRWVAAHRGVRLLAMGKTAALTGAAGAGALLGFAVGFLGQLHVPLSALRVVLGVVGAVGCALLTLAGRALQRACHIPDDDPPEPAR